MSPLLLEPAFQAYAVTSVALVALFHAIAFATGRVRDRRKTVLNPEDTRMYKGAHVVEMEHIDVQRIKRAHLNLMENALPFLAIGFLYCMTQPSALLARSLFFGFFALRVLHTLFYLRGMQPARALSFMGGVLVNVAMAVQVVHAIV